MSSSLALIARLIAKSDGRQTAAQLGPLSVPERKRLAELLAGMGRPELVTWDVAAGPGEVDDLTDMLSERDARAVAVDNGVKASRFAAACALGEIEGMARDTKDRRWFEYEPLAEWIDKQVAGTDDSDAEQQDDDDDPGCAQVYRTPWGWIIFWLLAFGFIGWLLVKAVWQLVAV